MQRVRIVRFFRQRVGPGDRTFLENIDKRLVQLIDQARSRRMVETNHQILLHKAIGVKVSVKTFYLIHRHVDIIHDFEEAKLPAGNIAASQHRFAQENFPLLPIFFVEKIHENDRYDLAFTRLSQRERLAELVVSTKSAREYYNRIRFFHKHEFAGKEKMKVHELGIVFDKPIRRLYRRQTDIDPETILPSRSFVTSLHNARPGTGNNHKLLSRQSVRQLLGQTIVRIMFFDMGGAENAHFANRAIGRENFEGLAQLF